MALYGGVSRHAVDQTVEGVKTFSGTLDISGTFQVGGTTVAATATELNLLDGSAVANDTASKLVMLDSAKRIQNDAADGTAGTNVTAVEYGDGMNHTTILTLTAVAITIGDTAALAMGALIYTFPAGALVINSATLSVGLNLTTGTPTTDTPEIGLGSVLASGANATLGASGATSEDICGPAVADDIAGTAELTSLAPALVIEASGGVAHLVHLNFADTWANVDNTAATATGTVVLNWTLLPLS